MGDEALSQLAPIRVLRGVRKSVILPHPLVIVAEGWSGMLVAACLLDLPILGVFVPPSLHHHFRQLNPKQDTTTWQPTLAFQDASLTENCIPVLSGSPDFIRQMWSFVPNKSMAIVSLELPFSRSTQDRRHLQWILERFREWELQVVKFPDADCGGATSQVFPVAFGSAITPVPRLWLDLQYSLDEYVDGGVEGLFPAIRQESIPPLTSPPRKVLWHEDCVRIEGLFPHFKPSCLVLCPSYRLRHKFAKRKLTAKELLRLYQLPLSIDATLAPVVSAALNNERPLPFERSITPVICTAILRQLWDSSGGVEVSDLGAECSGDTIEATPATADSAAMDPAVSSVPIETLDDQSEFGSEFRSEEEVKISGVNQRMTASTPDYKASTLDSGPHSSLDSLTPFSSPTPSFVAERTSTCSTACTFPSVKPVSNSTAGTTEGLTVDSTDASMIGFVGGSTAQVGVGSLNHSTDDSTSACSTTSIPHNSPLRVDNNPSNTSNTTTSLTTVTSPFELEDEPDTDPPNWRFTFDDDVAPLFSTADSLTDDDTLTSIASEETRATSNVELTTAFARSTLEPHELEPPVKFNQGPPFAVGDEVFCEPAEEGIQRAFVVEAAHPRYGLQLEDGRFIDTAKVKTALVPQYAPGQFAVDPIDPFVDARERTSHAKGSFGVQIDAQLDALRRVREEKEFAKATKADDAEVPIYLWNDRVLGCPSEELKDKALSGFRIFGLQLFLRALRRDSAAYLRAEYGPDWTSLPRKDNSGNLTLFGREQLGITEMIWHATHTNWFEYKAGSKLVHFRFPLRYRRMAKEGVEVYFEKPGPSVMDHQPSFSDPAVREAVKGKIEKVLHRRYMLRTSIKGLKSLIKYFAVPKGEADVRIVYDGTANDLNACIWVPSFWLPTMDTLVRAVDADSWMADRDIADMFLNFQLHPSVRPYTGVDLKPALGDDASPRYAYWDRCLMGFTSSPYNAVKTALVVEEVAKGDRHDEANPFHWHSIRLNLPGTPGYDPKLSWVSKLRKDGLIACDLLTFMDDERVVGPTRELTWQASHRLATIQSYLGVQDAARKLRPVSKTPGAWAGAVVHLIATLGVCVLTSEEKWARVREIVDRWLLLLESGETMLPHKKLLSDRGFLVYVTRTYPSLVPYMKGFHLSADMWRGNRDAEGWKLRETDDSSLASNKSLTSLDITRAGSHGLNLDKEATFSPTTSDPQEAAVVNHLLHRSTSSLPLHAPPSGLTPAVPRFLDDLKALKKLTDSKLPPLRVVRPTMVVHVLYGFGDAAGKSFGATVSSNYNCKSTLSSPLRTEEGLFYRLGVWTAEEKLESSNFKELCNLVETAEEEARDGRLTNCQFFLFTDNAVAESCFFKGSSKSPKLHSLIVRLRKLEMEFGLSVLLIHVSGTRMIAQGTDGCSRGLLMEGVMAGADMLTFVDLSKNAIERHPPLLDWIRSWADDPQLVARRGRLEPLTPEGWFEEGHGIQGGQKDGHGIWIPKHEAPYNLHLWAPPPAAADAMLEELLKARQKRTDTFHVIVIPRLMAPWWRRLFNKVCDFSIVVSPNVSFWPCTMYEPLWLGIILPFCKHRPWSFKRAPLLVEYGITLRRMLPDREGDGRDVLRKLLNLPRRISNLSGSVARGVLHMHGPSGDFSNC